MRLLDKVVTITGTGDGQGRAAALRFVAEGAKVVGCDIDAGAAARTEELVRDAGGDMLSLGGLDLTIEDHVVELVNAAIHAHGRIDALYNNAAGARMGGLLDISEADFDFTFRGVVRIPWLVSKHAAPHLAKSTGAAIVNTASISGLIGGGMVGNAPMLSAYSAAKAAVIRLSHVSAVELAPLGIRVNTISPGIIDTPAVGLILGRGADEKLTNWHLQHLLIQRIGVPDDVVNAALFLLSDDSSYVTGQNLIVDGGWAASGGVGPPRPEVVEALQKSLSGGLRY